MRSAVGNESHIFEIARQNLVLGNTMELRVTYFTLSSGHGAEGKQTHLCWVVRYILVGSQDQGSVPNHWADQNRAKRNRSCFRAGSAGGNKTHIFEIASQNLVLEIIELRELYFTLCWGQKTKGIFFFPT